MTDRHLSIVTGASRGLGRGIACALAEAGHEVLGLSRHAPPAPPALAARIDQWTVDLQEAGPVAARLAEG